MYSFISVFTTGYNSFTAIKHVHHVHQSCALLQEGEGLGVR